MTDEQYRKVHALSRLELPSGSVQRKFCRDLKFQKEHTLTKNQAAFLELLWNKHRERLKERGDYFPRLVNGT